MPVCRSTEARLPVAHRGRYLMGGATIALSLGALMGLPACASNAEQPVANVARPELRFALRLTGPDTWVSHTDGGGLWGLVSVKVWGDGRVHVSWGPPRDVKERDGKLSPGELAAFKATLSEAGPRLEPPVDRVGVPDETRLRFGSDAEELAYMVWYQDAPKYPAVMKLREAFLAIGDKVSSTSLPR